jgi:hypothetical protein
VLEQAATNRVLVDVVDHFPQRLGLGDVPVKASAGLPEETLLSASPNSCDAGEPVGAVPLQVGHCSPADWLLDGPEQGGDVIFSLPWMNKQVDVFRHEYIGPDVKVESGTRCGDRFRQPVTRTLRLEEAKTPKA